MSDKILLIDDDPDELFLFEEAFQAMRVFPILYYAENGQDALNKLACGEIQHPKIIFCDINMPVMGGWEFLKKIKNRELYKHIPVIIYSTSSNKREVAKALELGSAYFFTKPAHYEQLKFKLQEIIETFAPFQKELS